MGCVCGTTLWQGCCWGDPSPPWLLNVPGRNLAQTVGPPHPRDGFAPAPTSCCLGCSVLPSHLGSRLPAPSTAGCCAEPCPATLITQRCNYLGSLGAHGDGDNGALCRQMASAGGICRALAAARCWDAGDPWGLWHLHCALGADNPTRPSKLLRRADRLVIMVCLPHGKWGTNWFSEQHPRLPTAACVVWCIYSVISSQGLFHPLQSSPVAPASPLTITSR